jgi:hypothetical protein
MATRTKPLVSAATLASAAAIAVASTAIAPSLNLPTPNALSAAKVQLATFSDVLSVPSVEWTDLLFGNTSWGGVLWAAENSDGTYSGNWGATEATPQDKFGQAAYVNPWVASCTNGAGTGGSCYNSGPSGALYLFMDALVNGNGSGFDNSDTWSTGVVNYLFEPNSVFVIGGGSSPVLQYVNEGWSAASWYLLQTTLSKAIPSLTVPLAAAYWGPTNVSVFYNLGLSVTAALVGQVPVVGPFIGNSILAYLGDLEIPDSGGTFYQYGLSGALNYWVDIATGSVPFPTSLGAAAAVRAAASTRASAAATAADAPAVTTEAKTVAASDSTPATDAKADATPATKASESTPTGDNAKADDAPAAKASETTPAAEAPASTSVAEAPASTTAADAPAVEAPASTPEADAPAASTPEVKDSTPTADSTPAPTKSAPAKTAPKHPVRDAVEKVGKQISSAINNAKAAKTAKADSAG